MINIQNISIEMETISAYPKFIPIEASVHLYNKWDCQVVTKTHEGIYYKCLEGNGVLQMINGNQYEGNFSNGMFHGKGVFKWKTGITYSGNFESNELTGNGKFQWLDGSMYEGEVLKGYRHGFGKYKSIKENYVYEGFWKNGKKEGKGKITYNDGKSSYEGQFVNDLKHGTGKMIYPSQNQYEGSWKQNRKDGYGVMNWIDIHEKYVGEWKNDVQEGYGEYFWFDNKVQFKILKNIYKGNWKNGKRNGLGGFFHSNGCKFQGFYRDNLKEGIGISYDEYGFAKIQKYKQDKPISLLQKTFRKNSQQDLNGIQDNNRLPKISKQTVKTDANREDISSIQKRNNTDNQYRKYIDFNQSEINENLFNFLLRLNSRLRSLYKLLCLPSYEVKDFYSGMTLQNYWKVIRDAKILNESIPLIKISKEFFKGDRSFFQVTAPDAKIFQILQDKPQKQLQNLQLHKLLWTEHIKKLKEVNFSWNENQQFAENIDLPKCKERDICKSSQVILYRHFVCLIVHTAVILLGESETLKSKVETIITSIQQSFDNVRISTEKQKITDNITQFSQVKSITVPDWIKAVHDDLIRILCPDQPNILGIVQIFVPVRVIYSILEENGMFKDSNEKILSLERMERYLNIKVSFIKKQWKNHFQDLEKVIKDSPSFDYLMKYPMNQKEIHEFLFFNINRKITASSPEQFKIKYKNIIQQIIQFVNSVRSGQQYKVSKTLTRKKFVTHKDEKREQLLLEAEQLKRKLAEQNWIKAEQARQKIQQQLMAQQDRDIEDLNVSSNLSSEYYL